MHHDTYICFQAKQSYVEITRNRAAEVYLDDGKKNLLKSTYTVKSSYIVVQLALKNDRLVL